MSSGRIERRHGSLAAIDGNGVLILGRSGSGKSGLLAELICLGGELIADDQVVLVDAGGVVYGQAPDTLSGIIELRGIGLRKGVQRFQAPVCLIVDLDQPGEARMPEPAFEAIFGLEIPKLAGMGLDNLAAKVMIWIRTSDASA